ncbi:MAG TPA: electron transfer flavoprotein subunit alpha/FixB family protein, partial [Propionibacteriaceae bacterium]|nr:electron transfer flavoprotein subunit alpha/FixB family protein [Propionibacteriaceae bacterium]
MSEVLIVAEQVDSHVSRPALELLTLARRLGDPVAVVFGEADETVAKALAEYGAIRVLSVSDPALNDYLVTPKAEALAQIAETVRPAAILITSTPEGKEIAGRLAVKLESGLITDATDLAADGTTTQSVFAGNWTVTAAVPRGVPVITVKPNAVTPEVAPAEPAIEQVEVTVSDTAKSARIVNSEPKQSSGRPELTEAGVVVAGGRGTGGEFAAIEELADLLGGAVGASRAA